MKPTFICFVSIMCCLVQSPLLAQEDDFIKEYLERFENSKKYVIKVAEMMPEDDYNFKPTDGSLSFAENLMHIGFAMNWHSQSLLGGKPAIKWNDDTRYKVSNRTKEEMIKIVEATFEEAARLMEQFDTAQFKDELDYFGLTRTKRQIFMLLADHITHHRGQMLVYLRLNGLVPPRYVLFQ
ncbi:DinB family protein [uncultured Croceitalea sp.]|uniref:DinB family protein n=1 Tax=uncultured Croceitalea sp. TaxID=1798908 RepID=UPI003305F7DC